ncbi:GntR family transcriptional regulator [Pseudodonghicola flavimaris]|uniref:GntR family transcriptional regulator n=1 Tax=Pseudodonghicola flavimaris TaxID=3050036 RepID=A0ABT7F2L5_9RHOB|nr:GntR family transcriptional regulator [Pseudodonghicola flavimaris]MDK3018859.1 GntR family transcriptional regulator [Pseudodonghicola flavimaris]
MARTTTLAKDKKTGPLLPPKKLSLRDQAYEEIKGRIVSCELKPGEAVTVTELAEALGIGRTPVIQAVDRLMVDGLVEVMPRKGVVVSPVSLDELVDIIEVRLLNECRVARWAAERISDTQIADLNRNLAAMRKATETRNVEQLITLDREFHRLINASAGNAVMAELLGNLHDRSSRFWTLSLNVPDHNKRVCEQHAEIVEALAAHDADRAEKAVYDHITAFRSNLVENMLSR